jgi:hypothetical protein
MFRDDEAGVDRMMNAKIRSAKCYMYLKVLLFSLVSPLLLTCTSTCQRSSWSCFLLQRTYWYHMEHYPVLQLS